MAKHKNHRASGKQKGPQSRTKRKGPSRSPYEDSYENDAVDLNKATFTFRHAQPRLGRVEGLDYRSTNLRSLTVGFVQGSSLRPIESLDGISDPTTTGAVLPSRTSQQKARESTSSDPKDSDSESDENMNESNRGAASDLSDSDEEVIFFTGRQQHKLNNSLPRTVSNHAIRINGEEDQSVIDDYIANMVDYSDPGPLAQQSSKSRGRASSHIQDSGDSRPVDAGGAIQACHEGETTPEEPGRGPLPKRWAESVREASSKLRPDITVDAIRSTHESKKMPEEPGWGESPNGWGELVIGVPDDLFSSASFSEDEQYRMEEEDEFHRRIERMSDAHVARLFAKQAELGIDGDELVICDADTNSGSEEENVATRRTTASGRRRRRRALIAEEPLDDLLDGEDYGDFDPMDRSRPSIQDPGRNTNPLTWQLGLDQAQVLATAWEKDRQKKSVRKREREELRAQGLLSTTKKAKASERSSSDPFNLVKFGDTLESFMDDDTKQQLQLPPMDPAERKLVHELAHRFNIKSASHGSGNNRYTILYKTGRTVHFDDNFFERVCRQLGPKHARGHTQAFRAPHMPVRKEPGYRNGEVVGASAPELGVGNRGHKMLEKMGWAKGQALGAMNDGVLLPIPHVVRNTRAGLGG